VTLKKLPAVACLLVAAVSGLDAATLTFSGPGGFIPDFDVVPGEITSDATQVDPLNRTVLPGNSIEVRIIGLWHEYASDLIVRLTHIDSGVTRDLFGSIGISEGTPADSMFLVNYNFRTGFPGDLWATTIPLGTEEFIPGGDYFPTNDGSSAPNDLSSAFAGVNVNGGWRLTILDNAIDPEPPSYEFEAWELLIDVEDPVTVPEPSTVALFAAGCLAIARLRRRAS
jgi:hypothetical protein